MDEATRMLRRKLGLIGSVAVVVALSAEIVADTVQASAPTDLTEPGTVEDSQRITIYVGEIESSVPLSAAANIVVQVPSEKGDLGPGAETPPLLSTLDLHHTRYIRMPVWRLNRMRGSTYGDDTSMWPPRTRRARSPSKETSDP